MVANLGGWGFLLFFYLGSGGYFSLIACPWEDYRQEKGLRVSNDGISGAAGFLLGY